MVVARPGRFGGLEPCRPPELESLCIMWGTGHSITLIHWDFFVAGGCPINASVAWYCDDGLGGFGGFGQFLPFIFGPIGGVGGGGLPGHGRPGNRGRRVGGRYPNGETLGLPRGLNLRPLSLAQLLGLAPTAPGTTCDFGVCTSAGDGFTAAAAVPVVACLSDPVCAAVVAVGTIAITAYEIYKIHQETQSRTYPDIDQECESFASRFDGHETQCHYQWGNLGELCSRTTGSCRRRAFSMTLGPCDSE
jgi:hypothetical protein